MKCFEGQSSNFEMNTLMNWKPMEFFKRGSDMMVTSNGRIDDTGQGILNFLKAVQRHGRKTIVE